MTGWWTIPALAMILYQEESKHLLLTFNPNIVLGMLVLLAFFDVASRVVETYMMWRGA